MIRAARADRPREDVTLACRGLRKSFGSTVAVADVSLDVPTGSITALLGPSGCGKTTVLRLIAGFERPDAGAIDVHGTPVAGNGSWVSAEKRRVGMVFQDYALFPHLTVARNVGYGLQGLPREARATRIASVLELVGLHALAGRMPADLSGGQQQRVALARALAPSPEAVLLDEPFSNLDATLRASVRDDIRRILIDAGTTALFVTHDQEEALSIANEVAVMNEGRVLQVARPETLYREPADRFVATFVGDADVLPGTRVGRYFVMTPLGRLATTEPVGSEHVDVILRPESLRVGASPDGNATVESVVYFGHDQLMHLRLDDGTKVRARLGPETRFDAGSPVQVRVLGAVQAFSAEGFADEPEHVGANDLALAADREFGT